MSSPPLPQRIKDRIAKFHRQGYHQKAIAKRLGVSTSSVHRYLSEQTIRQKHAERLKDVPAIPEALARNINQLPDDDEEITQDVIKAACEAIQATWSDYERNKRSGYKQREVECHEANVMPDGRVMRKTVRNG